MYIPSTDISCDAAKGIQRFYRLVPSVCAFEWMRLECLAVVKKLSCKDYVCIRKVFCKHAWYLFDNLDE